MYPTLIFVNIEGKSIPICKQGITGVALSEVTNRLIWIDYSFLIKNRKLNRNDKEIGGLKASTEVKQGQFCLDRLG